QLRLDGLPQRFRRPGNGGRCHHAPAFVEDLREFFFGFVLAGSASPGMGGRQPRFGASSVPRQVAAPHEHGYSAFSFLV
ncbi:hypothetical protein JVW24_20940, partial [Vibrio cholerae O1]|nr:hypothetical protein [Vibrio cholerae O1]